MVVCFEHWNVLLVLGFDETQGKQIEEELLDYDCAAC